MKKIFLIPPSEGKKLENLYREESLSFPFEKPLQIAQNATEKDLKCRGQRYEEGISFNANIEKSNTTLAINRYSGVMYSAIDYQNMSEIGREYFDEYFLIVSGMYGILRPYDKIRNYKLPIETKGLYDFWGKSVVETLRQTGVEEIISFLPLSYARLIGIGKNTKIFQDIREVFLKRNIKLININFLKADGKKMAHGVKKAKGKFIKALCESGKFNYKDYNYEENNGVIEVFISEKEIL